MLVFYCFIAQHCKLTFICFCIVGFSAFVLSFAVQPLGFCDGFWFVPKDEK
jgi:hypothetical protein